MKKSALVPFLILFSAINAWSSKDYSVSGKIFNSGNKNPIPYASVILKQSTNVISSILSEENGGFSLGKIPPGKYRLDIKQPGFYPENIDLDLKRDKKIVVYLIQQITLTMNEIEVAGEKQPGTVSKDIITKEMRNNATTSITGDPLNVLSKMPGVSITGFNLNTGMGGAGVRGFGVSLGNGLSGISVRGGASDENAALLDDVQIEYPFHSFLPDSVFIDDLVDNLILYKGIYSPRYGQAMSSMLDISQVDPAPGFHGKVNIGLLNAYVTIMAASTNKKWSFIGGIKRTHYDLIIPLFFTIPSGLQVVIPYYLDSHGKLRYKDKNDTVSLLWQLSGEPGKIVNATEATNLPPINATLDTWHFTGDVTWKHIFSHEFFLNQSLDYGLTANERHVEFRTRLFENDSQEHYFRFKETAGLNPVQNFSVNLGAEALYYSSLFYTNFARSSYTNTSLQYVTNNRVLGRFHGSYGIYAGFADFDWSITSLLHFSGGIREGWADWIQQWAFDPRATLEYTLSGKNKIYIAWGGESQFPADPSTLASLTTNNIHSLQVPEVYHHVVGFQLNLPSSMKLTTEGWYKIYNHELTVLSNIEGSLDTTGSSQNIYGIDILLEKAPDSFPIYGWLSVSGLQSWMKLDHGFMNSSLNSLRNPEPPVGTWYTDDDKDFQVDLTAVWQISKLWTLTAEFDWHTGAPYTPVTGTKQVPVGTNTVTVPVFGPWHSARLENGSQLNLKLAWQGKVFNHIGGLYLQVNNAYNHKPITGYSYSLDYTVKTPVRSFIGIYPIIGFWMGW